MSRTNCAERLKNVISVLENIDLDVTPLFSLVDDFITNITDRLHTSVKEGESAEKLLEKLQD